MSKTTKVILILISALIISYSAYQFNKSISLGEIELELGSQTLSDHETHNLLSDVINYFKTKEPSTLVKAEIDSAATRTFLSKKNFSLIEEILSVKQQDSTEVDTRFFQNNKMRLYGLVFKLLNQVIYLKYKHPDQVASIRQYGDLANSIAYQFKELLNNTFVPSQVNFYFKLEKEQLLEKLKLEAYYQNFYKKYYRDPKRAINFLGPGLKLAQKIGDKKREIDFLSRLQFMLSNSFGMTNIGLALGNYLLEETNILKYELNKEIVLYTNGTVLSAKGQYRQALKHYEMSKDLSLKYDFQASLISKYERIGSAHLQLGQYDLALQNYDKVNHLGKKLNRADAQLRYLYCLGAVHLEMGQYTEAETIYLKRLQLARKVKERQLEATTLISLGLVYSRIGDHKKSLQFHQDALKILKIAGNPLSIANTWRRLIQVYYRNNEIAQAKKAAVDAFEFVSKFDFGLTKGKTLLNIGLLQMEIGDLEPALESLNQSLQIFREFEIIRSQVDAMNLIGETQRRLGNTKLALETLNKAADLAPNLQKSSRFYYADFYLARVYKDLGQNQKAEEYLKKSIFSVKKIASKLINHEQRYNFSQKIQLYFEEMVLLQLAQNEPETAFFYAEEERAQVLKILLQNDSNEESKEITVKAALIPLQSKGDYEQRIHDLQNSLNDQTVLVEYEVTDSTLVSWVISHDDFQVNQVDISRAKIQKLVSEFRSCTIPDSLETSAEINRSFKKTEVLGERFYKYLISPIEKQIANAELVYFVPDEVLNYLPFATIRKPDGDYLISDFAISVVQSAGILQDLLQQKMTLGKSLLAIAANEELIHSVGEVEEVGKLQPNSESLIGEKITEKAVRNQLSATPYSIVLFSNYGKINETRPYFSAFVFNKDPNSSGENTNDGLLMVHEIHELDLKSTNLVFLSACESASGRMYRGEGIVGMQRAFLIAGANSVVANLWLIDDKAAKELTIEFFKKWLNGGFNKAEALRQAQLKMIERLKINPLYDYPHPYFWAAATLNGAYK